MTKDTAEKILKKWNISFRAFRKDIVFYGSPERSKERYAVEDTNNVVYVLEKLHEVEIEHKEKIAQIVTLFHGKKLPVANYIKTISGAHVANHEKNFYLLSKFIHGVTPQRPEYTADAWRGKAIGKFLVQLHKKSTSAKSELAKNAIPTFYIKEQVVSLTHKISDHDNEIVERITPILNFLEKELFEEYEKLPIGFCHGDVHVMNIIWAEKDINAVIDWEFFGYKPEIYDLALSIGCIGIEHPNYLQDAMSKTLIRTTYDANIYQKISWEYFYELIIAIRLMWLEFWLKNNDQEMIELELTYIEVLIKERNYLKQVWGL